MAKLSRSFYLSPDVIAISRSLLGKRLVTCVGGEGRTGGIIVETEAYAGPEDRASHAHNNRRTQRTETMYRQGGVAYVYLCYGIHALFNVVTNALDIPHAVLVRAVEPDTGIDIMLKRRRKHALDRTVAGGPGALTMALGITTAHDGIDLRGSAIWIEDAPPLDSGRIVASPRIGVGYAGSHADRPWRFRVRDNPWTSPAR